MHKEQPEETLKDKRIEGCKHEICHVRGGQGAKSVEKR